MAVYHANIPSAFLVFQNNALRQFFFQLHIMIPKQFAEPATLAETFEFPVDVVVALLNLSETAVFPEFFSVSKFQIEKSF